jgi:hypothetical protein
MHDMGKVILAANFDEQYHQAHAAARKEQRPLWEVEKEILGASHGEIGAYLLSLWGMSADVVRVAALHHHPLLAGDQSFTPLTAVHAANALEYEGDPNADGLTLPVIDPDYLQQLGLEARVESWRRARRNPEETKFETRKQRAKATAKPGNPAPVPAKSLRWPPASLGADVPPPVLNSQTPSEPGPALIRLAPAPPPAFSLWPWRSRWVALGLGVSAILALLARLEIMRLESRAEKPKMQEVVEKLPPPVKHELARKAVQEPKPPPAPPAHAALVAALPPPPPAAPAPVPVPPPAPETTVFDRLKLEAIFFRSQHPSALINGQLAGVNQLVADCRVLEIGPTYVTLEYQHQRRTLNIQ